MEWDFIEKTKLLYELENEKTIKGNLQSLIEFYKSYSLSVTSTHLKDRPSQLILDEIITQIK